MEALTPSKVRLVARSRPAQLPLGPCLPRRASQGRTCGQLPDRPAASGLDRHTSRPAQPRHPAGPPQPFLSLPTPI